MARLRVIVDGACDGYWNMAVDEALFLLHRGGDPVLRVYTWRPTTVTIGYGESVSESISVREARARGWLVVRRPTGGGVIIHEEGGDVTYSLVAGTDIIEGDIASSSAFIARGVALALRRLGVDASVGAGPYQRDGPPLCYARGGSSAVVVRGRKISGSAQRRRGGRLLQHGTLVLHVDYEAWAAVLRMSVGDVRRHAIGLSEVLDSINPRDIVEALVEGFSEALGLEPYHDTLTGDERMLAESLVYKYRSVEWTMRKP